MQFFPSKTKSHQLIPEKLSPEEELIKNTIVAFEELTTTILHTMEYWDRRSCTLTKPLPSGQKGKKGNKPANKKGDRKSPTKKIVSSSEIASTPHLLPTTDPEIGVPCWLIRDVDPERAVEKMISQHLQNDPILLEAASVVKASLEEVLVESTELYSVLYVPPVRKEKNVSKVFMINDVNEQGSISNEPTTEMLQVSLLNMYRTKMSYRFFISTRCKINNFCAFKAT